MKWFEQYEIKNRELLTDEEIAYLTKPSLAGIALFYTVARRHQDLYLTFAVIFLCMLALGMLQLPPVVTIPYFIIGWLLTSYISYFAVRYGRRLSWNRNNWESVDHFKKSEGNWERVAFFFMLLWGLQAYHDINQAQSSGLHALFIGAAFLLPRMAAPTKKQPESATPHEANPTNPPS